MRLIVVLHVDEVHKFSNTGRLAKLVVPDCSIVIHGPTAGPRADLRELSDSHAPNGHRWQTLLFFPGLGARTLTPDYIQELRAPAKDGEPRRLRLVIPDGTWSQARRLVKRLPELAALPRVILPVVEGSFARGAMRPRTNADDPIRVSTCEAIATAVGMLGSPTTEAALLKVYDAHAYRIARLRGKVVS